jgi:hypothetical protein
MQGFAPFGGSAAGAAPGDAAVRRFHVQHEPHHGGVGAVNGIQHGLRALLEGLGAGAGGQADEQEECGTRGG